MMTDIPLNTYIEWTDFDRERGECPVPDGSDVTVWFADGTVERDSTPEAWLWDDCRPTLITGYLVHSVPREPLELWVVVDEDDIGQGYRNWRKKEGAENWANEYGGRVVKLVEVDDD